MTVPTSAAPIGPDPTGDKKRLADQISRFFMAFIATGNPNHAKQNQHVPAWPKYKTSSPENYYFHEGDSHVEADTWRKEPIHYLNYEVGHQLLV
jgi:carboxylesterase type B